MTSLSSAQTALAGLAEVALADAAFTPVIDSIGAPALDIVAPKPARPFIAAALAARTPVLLVTATGREADDLTSELTEMLGGGVAQFPSWETLPHERLSPSADTVGRRVEVLRRLARPDDASYGSPLRVIVTTVRSLVQPMAPGLGEIEPITLRVGTEID
ncbi:MAG: transcription-repair coupling factor, partial [Rhodococcus sp. (in: high G+C Gram-positive bacteria)]|nr:transcription-repair coupling factor [Rhodococcus sp. (in: high G+C Gram-positive bacteria)]